MDKSISAQEKKPGFSKRYPKTTWTIIIIFGMAFIGNFLPDTNHNNAISAQQFCEITIGLQLKDESSGEYSNQKSVSIGNDQWEITGKVKAKNSFNTNVDSSFYCKLQYKQADNSFGIIDSKIK